jgi:hypothetical protein
MTKQVDKKDKMYQMFNKATDGLKRADLTSWLCFCYGALTATECVPEHTIKIMEENLEFIMANKIGGE